MLRKPPQEHERNSISLLGPFDGDPHEESSHIEKYFWGPSSVILDDDHLYVVDSTRHRVQVFDVQTSG